MFVYRRVLYVLVVEKPKKGAMCGFVESMMKCAASIVVDNPRKGVVNGHVVAQTSEKKCMVSSDVMSWSLQISNAGTFGPQKYALYFFSSYPKPLRAPSLKGSSTSSSTNSSNTKSNGGKTGSC